MTPPPTTTRPAPSSTHSSHRRRRRRLAPRLRTTVRYRVGPASSVDPSASAPASPGGEGSVTTSAGPNPSWETRSGLSEGSDGVLSETPLSAVHSVYGRHPGFGFERRSESGLQQREDAGLRHVRVVLGHEGSGPVAADGPPDVLLLRVVEHALAV